MATNLLMDSIIYDIVNGANFKNYFNTFPSEVLLRLLKKLRSLPKGNNPYIAKAIKDIEGILRSRGIDPNIDLDNDNKPSVELDDDGTSLLSPYLKDNDKNYSPGKPKTSNENNLDNNSFSPR